MKKNVLKIAFLLLVAELIYFYFVEVEVIMLAGPAGLFLLGVFLDPRACQEVSNRQIREMHQQNVDAGYTDQECCAVKSTAQEKESIDRFEKKIQDDIIIGGGRWLKFFALIGLIWGAIAIFG